MILAMNEWIVNFFLFGCVAKVIRLNWPAITSRTYPSLKHVVLKLTNVSSIIQEVMSITVYNAAIFIFLVHVYYHDLFIMLVD